jgi:hypothetical protein
MVTYLGSGLPIIYHGPQDAAAGNLLSNSDASIALTSLDPNLIFKVLDVPDRSLEKLVENALNLAQSQFMLSDVQSKFWNVLLSHRDPLASLIRK